MTYDHNDPDRNRGMEALRGPDPRDAEIARLRDALQGLLNALPSATTHPAIKAARAALSGE